MNRREFSKAAFCVAGAALVAPAALALEPHAIADCIVIDYEKNARRWRHLDEPDDRGHTFIYEDTGKQVSYRHFELLRNDGLVMGESARVTRWSEMYHAFESEFLHARMQPGAKAFTRDEFLDYVLDIRDSLNGRIVPVETLPGMEHVLPE